MSENFAEFQQRRGAIADIVIEALNTYDGFMADDDYDAWGALRKIMDRMRERAKLYSLIPHQETQE